MMMKQLFFLAASLVAAAPCVQRSDNITDSDSTTGTASINDLFVAKGKKYYGTITDPGLLSSTQNAEVIKSYFGQLTPENSMKWDATEGTRGQFTFDNADTVVSFAEENGLLMRGHTLLWHSQLPSWVSAITDADELTSVIETHVTNIVEHFKGKIYAWVGIHISLLPCSPSG